MFLDFLIETFQKNKTQTAIVWRDKNYSYSWLLNKIKLFSENIKTEIEPGLVVALYGDFTPNSIAFLLALIQNSNIIVPFVNSAKEATSKKHHIAQIEYKIFVDQNDKYVIEKEIETSDNEHYKKLKTLNHPGLVLFTSGTSGEPKAAVHDFTKLLEKFKVRRTSLKILNFLLFDHWGGLNTMFHTLSNEGTVFATSDRNPDNICRLIERYSIELLPASPTFLNLLLISEAYKRYDLSSLKIISYGTEPMPEGTLKKLRDIFPEVKLQQTYGLIELGVLRSKSKDDGSLWVKIGGEGFDLRVVDNILQIKADSAMLGYLNADDPFTEDGYFITGDYVEVDGDYMRILGRKSEIINVGGEKVYPAEVESVIQEVDNVKEATVYGERNPLTGKIVCAKVLLLNHEDPKVFKRRLKKYCFQKLEKFKVPVKIFISEDELHGDRFKKQRRNL